MYFLQEYNENMFSKVQNVRARKLICRSVHVKKFYITKKLTFESVILFFYITYFIAQYYFYGL